MPNVIKQQQDDEILTRDEILAADDIAFETVEVPEWGKKADGSPKKVRIKCMTSTERDAWENSLIVNDGGKKGQRVSMLDVRAKLLTLTIVDVAGNPQFTLMDVETLGRKSAAAADRVFEVSKKLSRVSDEDVEEIIKNSEKTPDDNSSGPSQ